jgi:GTP-binding protein EngB required for normal cell division
MEGRTARNARGALRAEQPADSATDRLRALAEVAREAGADAIGRDGVDLADRLGDGRFFVACVGQFKRGKSTLLNALVGRPLLPTGVVPVTTVVTVLRDGERLGAIVQFADGHEVEIDPARLPDYVTEAQNPENQKGVALVEVSLPSPVLGSGVCLVDTPGIGSVLPTNSAVTRSFVPQIDAALFVLGTDPPISWDELTLLEAVTKQVDHVIVVLNKSDRVSESESCEAAAFTARVIRKHLHREVGDLYRVSAAEHLSGRVTRDWPRLEEALASLGRRAGEVLEAAAVRGLSRLVGDLTVTLEEQRDALVRPIEESERRLADLRRAIEEADHAMRELSARFSVEAMRLSSRFAERRRAFLTRETPEAETELAETVRSAPFGPRQKFRETAMDAAARIAKRRISNWTREVEPQGEALYAATMKRFVELGNEFAVRLVAASSAGLAVTQDEFRVERGFREDTGFYFTSLMTLASPGLWTWVLDFVRPRPRLVASAIRQAARYLERLLVTNSARMANDLTARVQESQRLLESEMRARLSGLVTTAEGALERARFQQRAGADAVAAEIERIAGLREQVRALAGPAA